MTVRAGMAAFRKCGPMLEAVRFDLALTVSAMRYISDVSSGKVNPEVFSFGLHFYQKKCDLPGTLRELTNARDVAADLDRLGTTV